MTSFSDSLVSEIENRKAQLDVLDKERKKLKKELKCLLEFLEEVNHATDLLTSEENSNG